MKSLNKAQRSQVVFRHQVHGVSRKKAKERFKIKEANKEIKEYNKEIKEYN
jgi:peptidoglycan hydrolase CwlO-like protein